MTQATPAPFRTFSLLLNNRLFNIQYNLLYNLLLASDRHVFTLFICSFSLDLFSQHTSCEYMSRSHYAMSLIIDRNA